MNLKNLIVIGLVAVLGGCISIETTESQEGKQQFSTQQESSPTPTPTVERIVIRDSVKVTSESSAVGTGVKHLTLGDTVNVEAVEEIPEAQVYRGKATLYENGEPIGEVDESSIGVIEGYMRVRDSSYTYKKREKTLKTGSQLSEEERVSVREFNDGFYRLAVNYDEFVPVDKLVSEVSYWNTAATTYDLWVDMLWKEIFSKISIFVGDSWRWAKNFSREKRPEEVSFIYEVSVDRIKWGRMSDYRREEVLNSSYNKLKSEYYNFEKKAKYCPVIVFKISGPRIQDMKVAESNCEDAWYRGRP